MPIHFPCPQCGANLSVIDERAGLVVECRACAARVRVPRLPAPAALPALEPEGNEEEPIRRGYRCPYCRTTRRPLRKPRRTMLGCSETLPEEVTRMQSS